MNTLEGFAKPKQGLARLKLEKRDLSFGVARTCSLRFASTSASSPPADQTTVKVRLACCHESGLTSARKAACGLSLTRAAAAVGASAREQRVEGRGDQSRGGRRRGGLRAARYPTQRYSQQETPMRTDRSPSLSFTTTDVTAISPPPVPQPSSRAFAGRLWWTASGGEPLSSQGSEERAR